MAQRNTGGSTTNNPANNDADGLCFSCPFCKHDPIAHEACRHLKLKRIKDVKEHLQKRHAVQPLPYCPRCGRTFDDMATRDAHVSANDDPQQCIALPGGVTMEGLHPQQLAALQRRANRSLSHSEQWMEIWDIIYPGVSRPSSPFIGTYIEETMRILKQHWKANGMDLLTRASANQPSPQQMVRTVIEELLNGVLARDAAANRRPVPPRISLDDPDRPGPSQVPDPNTTQTAVPGAMPGAVPGVAAHDGQFAGGMINMAAGGAAGGALGGALGAPVNGLFNGQATGPVGGLLTFSPADPQDVEDRVTGVLGPYTAAFNPNAGIFSPNAYMGFTDHLNSDNTDFSTFNFDLSGGFMDADGNPAPSTGEEYRSPSMAHGSAVVRCDDDVLMVMKER